ncbi:hypothetical protein [uncultured Winogradskyella sp.]|uniref:hypothetical protein n=1 Tax=uncultured Winogradskyella sp. TaxID=395353 RepID=UPI0030ED06E7|tara:strand:+ start:1993 stop:2436 length:444 start_codon:yes stop_codon:yes gene_type:complete
MNVAQYNKRLKSFSVESSIEKSIKKTSKEIIKLNTSNLDKGLNSNGAVVGTYSFFTIRYAKRFKPRKPKIVGSRYNFYWTGKFIKGIFITYQGQKIKFSSTGMGYKRKTRFITNNNLLGVTSVQSQKINYGILAPKLQEYFQKHISR